MKIYFNRISGEREKRKTEKEEEETGRVYVAATMLRAVQEKRTRARQGEETGRGR